MNKSCLSMVAGATLMLAGGFAQAQSGYHGGYGAPGHGRPGPASQVVRCESHNHRRQHCRVDTRGGVTLVRQLSNQRCQQGRNWGQDRNGIWVANGCRAEFAVGRAWAQGHRAPPFAAGHTVRCESSNHAHRRCNIAVQRSVSLTRQLSDASCVRGRTWGWDRGGIWVDRGCRAEFAVL